MAKCGFRVNQDRLLLHTKDDGKSYRILIRKDTRRRKDPHGRGRYSITVREGPGYSTYISFSVSRRTLQQLIVSIQGELAATTAPTLGVSKSSTLH